MNSKTQNHEINVNVNEKRDGGLPSLHLVAGSPKFGRLEVINGCNTNVEVVKFFVERGMDVNKSGENTPTPFPD